MRAAARGTAWVFAASGAVQATWLARLPALNERLDLKILGVSVALGMVGIGWFLSMPLATLACRRYGPRRVVWCSLVTTGLALVGISIPTALAGLSPVLVAFGLSAGAWDLAMNVHGSRVESREPDRHPMPVMHGFWSLGTGVAAALGAVAAKTGVPLTVHFALVAIVAGGLCVLGVRQFERYRPEPPAASPVDPDPRRRRLWLLAGFMLCAALLEGAGADWLAIFFTEERDTSHARAAAAYAVFAFAMAAGRFGVARLNRRVGRRSFSVRVGAVLAAAGVLLVALVPHPIVGYVGAALWGLGVCADFPAAISASGESRSREPAIAAVATVGYGGSLIGPVLIGAFALEFGLSYAFVALLLLAVGATLLARQVDSAGPPSPSVPAPRPGEPRTPARPPAS